MIELHELFRLAIALTLVCGVYDASIYVTEKEAVIKVKKIYAFSVFTKTELTAARAGQVIDFELNHRDEDHVYNHVTNVFKAPVTGVYMFFFSAVAKFAVGLSGRGVGLQLDLHSSEHGPVARASASKADGQASNMVIAKVNQGVSFDVRIVTNGQVAKACDPACSVFGGYLLYETEISDSLPLPADPTPS